MPTTSRFVLSLLLTAACLTSFASSQDKPAATDAKPQSASSLKRNRDTSLDPFKTFYLKSGSNPNDGNEILTGLRLMLDPSVKVYLVPSLNAIMIRATPEDIALAEKMLADLDKPRRVYKLTYTVTEADNGKRIGVQHFTLTMAGNARTTLKNGSKVPVVTESGNSTAPTQFQYLDLGMNFDASLDDFATGVRLRSKVEQSSATEEKMIGGTQEPLIRQSVLEGTTLMTVGKPLVLGSIDVAGSTRHLDIEAIVELAN